MARYPWYPHSIDMAISWYLLGYVFIPIAKDMAVSAPMHHKV
jgi:hypothetical protein